MATDVLEKEDTDAPVKMREVYSFTVDKVEKVKVTETEERKNEDGTTEEVEVTKEVEEPVPYRVIIKQPNRREMEEAELEYSIEMSKCIKQGILTKAMLSKKYSDSGGLMAEEDASALTRLYMKFGEISNDLTRLTTKVKKTDKDKEKIKKLSGKLGETRKDIVDMETNYASLFNHTADSRAQNKAVTWYLLNLSYLRRDNEEDAEPIFKGDTFQDKIDEYYRLEEEGSELYDIISSRLATYISFWYYSAGAVTDEDFETLQKDIDEGNV
ncbi:MAG: hypothetical protein CMO74_14245 [Verrucomicrobiales bacterium]|nr:hypothetical protein [Verrucomicrobiales bacterium]|tara:strand:- start:9478 stop:10287 length:810 start_codon:yes stop_codon:yes gene_type:complete